MSGKFLENSILLRSTDSVIDVVNCGTCLALVTEQTTVKEIDIFYQKQIRSWSSNCWDKFTCGAVKDLKSNFLYAVVNHCVVWKWADTEESFDSVKKVTFKSEIKKLLIVKDMIYVLFKTGYLQLLGEAISSKKDKKRQIITDDETIVQMKFVSNEKYLLLTAGKNCSQRRIYIIDVESCFVIPELTTEIDDKNICQCRVIDMQLLTLYSNGVIYSKNIFQPDVKFPGNGKDKLTLIDTNKGVNIMEAGDHAVFQGRAADDEGDYLILWNYKYNLPVDEKRIKMSLDTPMGWSLSEGLALMEGHTLGHVSLELKQTTAALMFGIGARGRKDKVEDLKNIAELSIDDRIITTDCMSVESVNEIIAKKDLAGVLEWLKQSPFILEKILICVLQFALEMPDESFSTLPKSYFLPDPANKLKETDGAIFEDVKLPYSYRKFKYICLLLKTPYTESDLIREIDGLSNKNCEKLLEHLLCIVQVIKCSLTSVENLGLSVVNDWISLVWMAKATELMTPRTAYIDDLHDRSHKAYQQLNAEFNKSSEIQVEISRCNSRKRIKVAKSIDNSHKFENSFSIKI